MATLREQAGCWLHERWRTEAVLHRSAARLMGWRWEDLCNRHERLENGEDGARRCLWQHSSLLTVARFFPGVGGRLLAHCRDEWPVQFSDTSQSAPDNPRISVVLPVGGRDRIPLFQCALSAFLAQTVREVMEIIAVEHDNASVYQDLCPSGVRYMRIPRAAGHEFSRSRALNAGARAARAPCLLLHDSDVVPPARYVESLLSRLASGWDAVRPMRFLFQLDENSTREFVAAKGAYAPREVWAVQQNNPGVAVAMAAQAYKDIGGHDEAFQGWGGEDQEFADRLQTRRLYPGGYVPLIHLWHPAAPKKASGDRNLDLTRRLREIPPAERMRRLRGLYSGGLAPL